MATKKKTTAPPPAEQFTKQQLIAAKKFQNRKDILNAVLDDGKTYTINDAEKKISAYMKGKVN